jgi:hypothetical protein
MAITSRKQQQNLARTITGYLNSFQIVLKRWDILPSPVRAGVGV